MQGMPTFGLGPIETILLYVFSTFGLPQGIPPTKEDPLLLAVAPEKCLYYSAWSGTLAADPGSTNSTEKLLADPEIRKFAAQLVESLKGQAKTWEAAGGPTQADFEVMTDWITVLITKPGSMYIGDVTMKDGQPDVQIGIVLGAAEASGKLDDALVKSLQAGGIAIADVTIGGKKLHQAKLGEGELPTPLTLTFGVVNNYWMLTIGEKEFDALRARASQGNSPEWLTKLKQRLPIDRVSSLSYINLKHLLKETVPRFTGPFQGQIDSVLQSLGLDALTTLEAATGLSKDRFVSKTHLGFEGTPRGLLAFYDGRPLTPADLGMIPDGSPLAMVFSLDGAKVYDTLMASIRESQPAGTPDVDELVHAMDKQMGFSLRKDLLESLGDRAAIFIPPGGNPMLNLAITVDVKDRKRLTAVNQLLVVALQKLGKMGPGFPPGPPPGPPPGGGPMPPGPPPRPAAPPPGLGLSIKESMLDGARLFEIELPPGLPLPISPAWAIGDKRMVFGMSKDALKIGLTGTGNVPSIASNPDVAALLKGGKAISVSYQDPKTFFRPSYEQVEVLIRSSAGGGPAPLNLPPVESIEKHLLPSLAVGYRTAEGVMYESRHTMPGANVGVVIPVAVAVVLPAAGAARNAAQQTQASNNLKQIALAFHNYSDVYRNFPASYTLDKMGKPGLSWRVHLLPFLEQQELYKQFKLDEPWDSENNKALIAKMPRVYAAPGGKAGEGKTNYLGIRGPAGTMRPPGGDGKSPISFASITDGTSNTLGFVEAGDAAAVIWTKPDDYDPDEKDLHKGLGGLRKNGFLGAFVDGSVMLIPQAVAPETLKKLYNVADGQPFNRAELFGPTRGPGVPPLPR